MINGWRNLLNTWATCSMHFWWTQISTCVLWNSPLAPYLISLILSTMPLSSYQTNYLFFSILSLFGLVDDIIKFKSGHMFNMCLPHQSDTSPYGYFCTPYLLLWLDDIYLCFYWLIRLLICLSSYLLISDSCISDSSDSRIISHWRIFRGYSIGW